MSTNFIAHTRGINDKAIGICFVGNYDLIEVPLKMWELGLSLVRWLQKIYEIPTKHVYGHRDFANKSCPGKKFNMVLFRKGLL
jgi:N-acetyl-anhydromuramyl-L-alanine amidase AmpD